MFFFSIQVFYTIDYIKPRTKDEPGTKCTYFQNKYSIRYVNQKLSVVIFNISITYKCSYQVNHYVWTKNKMYLISILVSFTIGYIKRRTMHDPRTKGTYF